MNTNLPHTMRWLCGCLIFFYAACKPTPAYNKLVTSPADSIAAVQKIQRATDSIAGLQSLIRTGDLILRKGNDFTSESLGSLNRRDKSWSHCGIASIEGDSVFVYHALGGDFNPDQKILREPVTVFGDVRGNRAIGIFRYGIDTGRIGTLMDTVKSYYRQGIRFDMEFDLATDDRMYCAEFVCKAYERGTGGRLKFPLSRIGSFAFIGVDDLFLLPGCAPVKRILFR